MKLSNSPANQDQFNPFPDLNQPPQSKPRLVLPILLGILVLVSGAVVYLYFFSSPDLATPQRQSRSASNQTPSPSPEPVSTPKPLPQGRQIYQYSHGKNVTGPKPSQAIINPIDPDAGQTQTFTLTIMHPSPVTQAAITLTHDDGQFTLPLKLVSGTQTQGEWQATWSVNYTYDHTYQIDIKLSDGNNQFEGGLAFR